MAASTSNSKGSQLLCTRCDVVMLTVALSRPRERRRIHDQGRAHQEGQRKVKHYYQTEEAGAKAQ